MTQYYGKYRGKVENNIDPQLMGRIQVSCPAVLGGVTRTPSPSSTSATPVAARSSRAITGAASRD